MVPNDYSSDFQVVKTQAGDFTLKNSLIDETYHSINGAVAESQYVFIENGLLRRGAQKKTLTVLEFGFGTGLNAFLSLVAARRHQLTIHYVGIEKYKLPTAVVKQLGYPEILNEADSLFYLLHNVEEDTETVVTPYFSLSFLQQDFREVKLISTVDVVYYDAFSPDKQPELWTEEIFRKVYRSMNAGGVLVTYSAKGLVKQNLRAAGFEVKRLQGPPGKHHMVLARKNRL